MSFTWWGLAESLREAGSLGRPRRVPGQSPGVAHSSPSRLRRLLAGLVAAV